MPRATVRALEEIHTFCGVHRYTVKPLLCVALTQMFKNLCWAVTLASLPQKPDHPDVTCKPGSNTDISVRMFNIFLFEKAREKRDISHLFVRIT